jgi:hypothetical protein
MNWLLSNLIEEAEKDTEYNIDYKSKVKDHCFICEKICNPEKKFEYYVKMGNCCPECSGRIGRKITNKNRLEKMEKWFQGIIKENENPSK